MDVKISINNSVFFTMGRILIAFVCLMTAVYCFVGRNALLAGVPTFLGSPDIWIIIVGILWGGVGISFILKYLTRSSSVLLFLLVLATLMTSTYRGGAQGHTFIPTLLAFGFYLAFVGGGLMIGSRGQWMKNGFKKNQPISSELYYSGRILMGLFFFITGWVHFVNPYGDALMLGSMPGALFWVAFVGICWFCVALSFWMNILARTAALLASLLILIITLMINIKGFGKGDDLSVWLQIAKNMGVMGGCFLVAYRGNWGFKVSSWWYPPYRWGLNIGKTDHSDQGSVL